MTDADALGALVRRVERLEAERAVVLLLHRYGRCLDDGDEDGYVDCYTEDGCFLSAGSSPHHTTLEVRGHEELRSFARGHTRRPVQRHEHCVVDPLVEVDLDTGTARSVSNFFVLMEHEGVPLLRVFGSYRDRIVRGADGGWRFQERSSVIDTMHSGLPPLAWGMPGARA